MDETYIQDVKKKSIIGVATLIARTFFLQIVSLIAMFILTILLSPSVFGIYYIVLAIINILNYFADIGLASALIQKKDEPGSEDYKTTFTIQQLLVSVSVLIFLLLSESIGSFFNLTNEGIFLLRALLISFFLSSLKTIPSVILERKLEFGRKVVPQILEVLSFNIVTVFLAWRGFGLTSFAYAALVRGVVGVVAIYILSPWKLGFGISRSSARSLLSFGIPLQAGAILALVKDDLLTIYLGKVIPIKAEIGYIGWAKRWSEVPLRQFMDNIIAVSFPVYSRIQHNKEVLRKALEKTTFFTALFIFPGVVAMVILIKPVALVIPGYFSKWQFAFFSFYLLSVNAILASLSSPLVQALNALGKVKTTFILMLVWTFLTWAIIPILVSRLGFNGFAIGSFIISLTAFLPIFLIRRYTPYSPIKPLLKPTIGTIIMALSMSIPLATIGSSLFGVILAIISGVTLYSLFIYKTSKAEVAPLFLQLIKTIKMR
ncbi:oligosaccharide flippase family protein [Candidatus Gottesmanbacteria bacterium]|nr:oligosaccharide flippase family protein [Candidatus Gottesmanbacteria bacterium]